MTIPIRRLCLVAALSLPLWLPALPASAATLPGLQPGDVFDLELATAPQLSPDERWVVYVRRFADRKTDRRYSSLWLRATTGQEHRPLTSGNYSDGNPVFSPDGRRIAFVSDRDGSAQIWMLWLENGQIARISNLPAAPSGLAFSPDGRQIAFTMLVTTQGPKIADMPAPPKGATWAEPAKVIDRLVYRFNGAGYLDVGFSHLFVLPAEGGTPRQVSSGDFHHGPWGAGATGKPVFTPDGKSLLVSANRRIDWDLEPLDTEVWEFPLDGDEPRALTDRRGPDNQVTISPDGSKIAFVGFDDRYQGYQVRELYVAERDGRNPRSLTAALDRSPDDPVFSADGKSIVFRFDDQGSTFLGKVRVDGQGGVERIATKLGGGITSYSGSGEFSLGASGAVAFETNDTGRPGDVVFQKAAGAAQLLTDVNADLWALRQPAEVEELWATSKHDGRPVHAWLVKPPGFDPSKKYPLILEIHGGPFGAYGTHFDVEKQIWAARGFLVVYANPRGSTGYGAEFGNLIHHAYPGDDFYDLDSVVDEVVKRPYADPEELYVTGGSGGGVLTCWLIGRTDRYRAAATMYPVINWVSWVLTTDVPAFGAKYWFPAMPWEKTDHYMQRSLFSVFENVKTPTLVITGEADWRTPISESEQYYTALKLKGVESVLVRVPDEPHGIRARPSHHISKILHIAGWFEKHRKEGTAAP
ncbi:MAG: S9 family peptidase [Thermoanaerobaculia bacterium]|nr:S9 family peptidase [Thermoanaerobaculia bacterium]